MRGWWRTTPSACACSPPCRLGARRRRGRRRAARAAQSAGEPQVARGGHPRARLGAASASRRRGGDASEQPRDQCTRAWDPATAARTAYRAIHGPKSTPRWTAPALRRGQGRPRHVPLRTRQRLRATFVRPDVGGAERHVLLGHRLQPRRRGRRRRAERDRAVEIFDARTNSKKTAIEDFPPDGRALSARPARTALVAGGRKGRANTAGAAVLRIHVQASQNAAAPGRFMQLAFSPDGAQLAVAFSHPAGVLVFSESNDWSDPLLQLAPAARIADVLDRLQPRRADARRRLLRWGPVGAPTRRAVGPRRGGLRPRDQAAGDAGLGRAFQRGG